MKNSEKSKKKVSILTIIVCILLALVLIFGAVFGVINLVKYTSAIAYYGDSYIDEGEMNFLASRYKSLFMKELRLTDGIEPYDTPAFWEKRDSDGKKYGDRLKQGFKEYVSALLTAAAVYDSAMSFSGKERESYDKTLEDALDYLADGSVKDFDLATEELGFTWDDFKSANILLYKSERAKAAMYGEGGDNLILQSDMCMEYLETYTRVKLIFIRLEDKFVLDENGGFTYNSDGEVITEPLTPSELAERQDKIDRITSLINKEGGMEMSPEAFALYQKDSDGDKDMHSIGYYLNPLAEATAEFEAQFPEVVAKAYEMKIGEYAKVDCEAVGGVCFLYREAPEAGAYARETNPFFSDFYSDAADYLFPKTLRDLMADVKFKDSFDETLPISIPRNNKYYIKTFN